MFTRLSLMLSLFTIGFSSAQTPDTSSLNKSSWFTTNTYHNCIIKLRDNSVVNAYAIKSFYSPRGELIIRFKNVRRQKIIKVKKIKTLDFYDLHFINISTDDRPKKKYLSCLITDDDITLYRNLEERKVPVPIPIVGMVVTAQIPYDHSVYIIKNKSGVFRLYKSTYKEVLTELCKYKPGYTEKIKKCPYREVADLILDYNSH